MAIEPVLAVLFPVVTAAGLVGAVIALASGPVLRVWERAGAPRRTRIDLAASHIAWRAAVAAEMDNADELRPARVLRTRWLFGALTLGLLAANAGMTAVAATAYDAAAGAAARGWILGWGIAMTVILMTPALAACAIALGYQRLPNRLRDFMATTVLGRSEPPPIKRERY